MKVICIDNKNRYKPYLTIGKEYDCVKHTNDGYVILCNDFNYWFPKKLFITLEEQRDKRLKDIGI